jgi:hypothetical protein
MKERYEVRWLWIEREGESIPAYVLDCDPKKDAQFACKLLFHSTSAMLLPHYS